MSLQHGACKQFSWQKTRSWAVDDLLNYLEGVGPHLICTLDMFCLSPLTAQRLCNLHYTRYIGTGSLHYTETEMTAKAQHLYVSICCVSEHDDKSDNV